MNNKNKRLYKDHRRPYIPPPRAKTMAFFLTNSSNSFGSCTILPFRLTSKPLFQSIIHLINLPFSHLSLWATSHDFQLEYPFSHPNIHYFNMGEPQENPFISPSPLLFNPLCISHSIYSHVSLINL